MNTDLAMSTSHAHALRNFILDFNLTICIDAPEAEVACTYVSPNGFSSRIDRFMVTGTMGQRVLKCSIINNLLFSVHVPLKIRLDLNVYDMFGRKYCHRLAWHKASTERIDQYMSEIEYRLSMLLHDKGASQCNNAICKNMLMHFLDYIWRY